MTSPEEAALTSLALCWTLDRRDGAGLASTTHDKTLRAGGLKYDPAPGLEPAAITRGGGDETGAEMAGALSSSALRKDDLLAGRWDGALSKVSAIEWDGEASDPVLLATGELGETIVEGDCYRADLLGAASRLREEICPTTSPECRATLGDKRCGVNLAGRRRRGQVVASNGTCIELDAAVPADFAVGRLRWLSGPNCGLWSVVASVAGTILMLREPPRLPVQAGARILLQEGCDKRLETCSSRFNNVLNFRGEPHLPGNDLLTRYPGA